MRLLSLLSLAFLIGCPGETKESNPPDDSSTGSDTDTTDDSTGPADTDGDGSPDDEDCAPDDAMIFPGAAEVCDGADQNCDGTADEGVTGTFYADADSDGFGDAAVTGEACEAGGGWVSDDTDCDDSSDAVNPGATEACDGVDNNCDGAADEGVTTTFYVDGDADGYGDATQPTLEDCAVSVGGYANEAGDCDDADAAYHPGADESDCADPNDYNCDGSVQYIDADSDGYAACEDCDDTSAVANPGAAEICDGADNNCDGLADEAAAVDAPTWYMDMDMDGYGDPNTAMPACTQPAMYVADMTDCDDTRALTNPAAMELCNSIDDNCDGQTDEDSAIDAPTWYMDMDGDSYGDPGAMVVTCYQPAGYVADWTDCDDGDAAVNPVAMEYCDAYDNNCDGAIDENAAVDAETWYADADSDTYGDAAVTMAACRQPAGYSADALDCDDTDGSEFPGAMEYCDGDDDNCDGAIDENTAVDALMWYADADSDTYGDATMMDIACYQPAGYVADWTDCDDADGDEYPGAMEYCDGDDDNCDGTIDEDTAVDAPTWYRDSDSDTWGDPAASRVTCYQPSGSVLDNTDCNDADGAIYPGATEVCDGADNNCDGLTDEAAAVDAPTWYMDMDADGYGDAAMTMVACYQPSNYVADATDCNDAALGVNPGAQEVCDSGDVDENCDGNADNNDASASVATMTTYYRDSDSDGYGGTAALFCDLPTGYYSTSTDCDDARPAINPLAIETCNGVDEDCDGSIDDNAIERYYQDSDGDGFGNNSVRVTAACNSAPVGYRLDNNDCNDADVNIQPYAYDISGDTVDSDCNGSDTARVTYTNATVGDDSSTTINAASGYRFPFCGTNYSTFYMISNGRVTLGVSDTDYSETLAELAGATGDTAIMPYWDDLYTSVSGQLQYAQFSDAMAFYWIAVNECCTTNSSTTVSFSAVLFNDGTVLFTYGANNITSTSGKDGIVGWACGGTGTTTPTEINMSAISYPAGYWGYGTGAERAVVEQFLGASSSDANDLANTAVRLCSNRNGTLDHCVE